MKLYKNFTASIFIVLAALVNADSYTKAQSVSEIEELCQQVENLSKDTYAYSCNKINLIGKDDRISFEDIKDPSIKKIVSRFP